MAMQREDMKMELNRQVELKKLREVEMRKADRETFHDNLGEIDRKQKEEMQRRNERHQKYLGDGSNIESQVRHVEASRGLDERSRRESEHMERKRLEQGVREAEAAESRRRDEKRLKLKQITEEDRLLKNQFRVVGVENQPKEDMMSKVFERTAHQAYERRAKNDQIVEHIANKFTADSDKKTALSPAADYSD